MAEEQMFAPGSPRVLVAGATGLAGALAAQLLWEHPRFELAWVTGRADVGQLLCDVYPRHRVPLTLEELSLSKHGEADAAVVGYPHAAAAPVVASLYREDVRVVDLSADFRLSDVSTYELWYGEHQHADLLPDAVYGLTEFYRDEISDANLVANPGCFPTGALLALAPLARAGLIQDVVIDAKTGASGVGRTPTDITHFPFANDNVTPYKMRGHRHTPEIEQQLSRLGTDLAVQFQPHLVAMSQGKLTSCYVTPSRSVDDDELIMLYKDQYDDEIFVEFITDERAPTPLDVKGTNFCRILAMTDKHTGKLIVFSSIDNLWKGSASQAIQNLNVMFGLDEGMGILRSEAGSGVLL